MSNDLAVNSPSDTVSMSFFANVKSLAESVEPDFFLEKDKLQERIRELEESHERDLGRIAEIHELLYGEDIAAYGMRVASVFSRWEEEGCGPSLTALVDSALDYFGIDKESADAISAYISAAIAEIPNNLQYHGNEHYRKVLFHTIRLMATHNNIYEEHDKERVLKGGEIVTLLIAACIHDLGHEGGDNLREGVYAPGAMEQRAYDVARPYLEAAGLDEELAGCIETMVFCTDITFFAGDNSPCLRMKKIYKHYFWEDQLEDASMMMMGKLRRYDENPKLAEMAMMLHEADVGSSAGLSYEQTIKETINIMEERNLDTAGPKTVLAFLREQLGETMFTDAGKQLFGPVMSIVIDQAEREIIAGRQTFYEEAPEELP